MVQQIRTHFAAALVVAATLAVSLPAAAGNLEGDRAPIGSSYAPPVATQASLVPGENPGSILPAAASTHQPSFGGYAPQHAQVQPTYAAPAPYTVPGPVAQQPGQGGLATAVSTLDSVLRVVNTLGQISGALKAFR